MDMCTVINTALLGKLGHDNDFTCRGGHRLAVLSLPIYCQLCDNIT